MQRQYELMQMESSKTIAEYLNKIWPKQIQWRLQTQLLFYEPWDLDSI